MKWNYKCIVTLSSAIRNKDLKISGLETATELGSKEADDILQNDSDLEHGEYGNIFLSMYRALSLGETLDEMS